MPNFSPQIAEIMNVHHVKPETLKDLNETMIDQTTVQDHFEEILQTDHLTIVTKEVEVLNVIAEIAIVVVLIAIAAMIEIVIAFLQDGEVSEETIDEVEVLEEVIMTIIRESRIWKIFAIGEDLDRLIVIGVIEIEVIMEEVEWIWIHLRSWIA